MLARNLDNVAVLVDKDRVKSGIFAIEQLGSNTLILDDGMQFLKLKHEIDIVLVDCGSICKCIEHATGRQPDITLGKPDPNMLKGILDRHGLQPDEIAMVGDRIYTDTAMAHNAGAFGVLVLSGETTLETAEKVAEDARTDPAPEFFPPDLIVRDIKELGELLLSCRAE